MQLHPSLVAFLDGKGQRVIAGILSGMSGESLCKQFVTRRVAYVSLDAGLVEHCVKVGGFQPVQDVAQFFLLLHPPLRGTGFGGGPVQTA